MGERPTTTRLRLGTTGSMYNWAAPSLWQAIWTNIIPSGASPNSSGAPSRISRGWRSSIARRASRITTGSAQAPPIQPWISPSAVMMARPPCCADEGARRQTTVARANSTPWRASSLARSIMPQPSTGDAFIRPT